MWVKVIYRTKRYGKWIPESVKLDSESSDRKKNLDLAKVKIEESKNLKVLEIKFI